MKKLAAFHGDKRIKAKYLARVEAHRKADELVQGTGWEQNGVTRGCAVGCIFDAYDHTRGPKEIGVPEWLLKLADTIHEGLPRDKAIGRGPKTCWPRRFLDAIPVGANLEPVRLKFSLFLIKENAQRVRGLEIEDALKKQFIEAIEKCQKVNESAITTGFRGQFSELAVAESARSAAEWAEWAEAESAESAKPAATWAAARSAAYIRYCDKLLILLRAATQ